MITPSTTFNFLNASLDSRVSFSRALATATRINASGLIEAVAADTPRFDYDPITLICRGLLIEESRANLLTYSEQFDNNAWTKTAVTVTPNAVASPDGTNTADAFAYTATSSAHPTFQNANLTSGVSYTQSVYVKANGQNFFNVYGSTGFNSGGFVTFDLSAGVVASSNLFSGSIVNMGSGWYRCIVTATATATTAGRLVLRGVPTDTGSGTLYTGDGSSGVYMWGAQLEAGSATSYIKTEAASVTRNADVATITGTAFSGWWRSGPGSILVRALPSTVSGTRPLVQVDDATADNIISLRGNATNPELYIREGGADKATIDAGTISAAAYRLAGAWQAGSAAASLNSGLAVNGAPASIPAATQMRLGSDGTNYLNGHLQAVEYWPVRLSNAGLQNASSTAGYGGILAPVMQDATLYPQINRSFGI